LWSKRNSRPLRALQSHIHIIHLSDQWNTRWQRDRCTTQNFYISSLHSRKINKNNIQQQCIY
jgi:hypothetical protein